MVRNCSHTYIKPELIAISSCCLANVINQQQEVQQQTDSF